MDKLYQAIKLLDEYKQREKPVSEIILDRVWIAPGYVFVVEFQDKRYMLVNTSDFERLIAGLEVHHSDLLTSAWMGIPVVEDREKIRRIMCGIFEKAISMRSKWQPSY